MARKQKNITLPDAVTTQVNSLSYQGKVTVQVLHGDKVISTKKYTNNGLPDLFKYISYALAGTSYNALRPCKIALLSCPTTSGYSNPTTFDWNLAVSNNALVEVSPYVVYDASPVVTSTSSGYATIFRFKIPFNWLYRNSFNVLGLFTENNSACAYFLFTKDSGDTKAWDVQKLTDVTGNYSLVVEWTMEISNK